MQIRSFHFIVAIVAGWLGRQQEAVIEYLKEENRVLRTRGPAFGGAGAGPGGVIPKARKPSYRRRAFKL